MTAGTFVVLGWSDVWNSEKNDSKFFANPDLPVLSILTDTTAEPHETSWIS